MTLTTKHTTIVLYLICRLCSGSCEWYTISTKHTKNGNVPVYESVRTTGPIRKIAFQRTSETVALNALLQLVQYQFTNVKMGRMLKKEKINKTHNYFQGYFCFGELGESSGKWIVIERSLSKPESSRSSKTVKCVRNPTMKKFKTIQTLLNLKSRVFSQQLLDGVFDGKFDKTKQDDPYQSPCDPSPHGSQTKRRPPANMKQFRKIQNEMIKQRKDELKEAYAKGAGYENFSKCQRDRNIIHHQNKRLRQQFGKRQRTTKHNPPYPQHARKSSRSRPRESTGTGGRRKSTASGHRRLMERLQGL